MCFNNRLAVIIMPMDFELDFKGYFDDGLYCQRMTMAMSAASATSSTRRAREVLERLCNIAIYRYNLGPDVNSSTFRSVHRKHQKWQIPSIESSIRVQSA